MVFVLTRQSKFIRNLYESTSSSSRHYYLMHVVKIIRIFRLFPLIIISISIYQLLVCYAIQLPDLLISPDPRMNKATTRFTFIGHATTLIEIDHLRIMTDPILRSRVLHLVRHAPPIQPSWYLNIDVVLISHAHWDHLDIHSLGKITGDPLFIVPPGVDKILYKYGFNKLQVLDVGDRIAIGELVIIATPAAHDGNRLRYMGEEQATGFLIEGSQRIYFAGDTDIYPEMAEMRNKLDLALLPVWGWGPTLGDGHMDPKGAAGATEILLPDAVIPIHWGTLYPIGLHFLFPSFLVTPPIEYKKFAEKLTPEVEIIILPPGEGMVLE